VKPAETGLVTHTAHEVCQVHVSWTVDHTKVHSLSVVSETYPGVYITYVRYSLIQKSLHILQVRLDQSYIKN
jgi:hypothetical protein